MSRKGHGTIRADSLHIAADERATGRRHDNGRARRPPTLPDRVWDAAGIREALDSRHFGNLLLAYRRAAVPGLRQSELAGWLGISQGQLSRVERSETAPRDLAKLIRWAKALNIPQRLLWFDLSGPGSRTEVAETADAHPRCGTRACGMVAVFLRWQHSVSTVSQLSGLVADDDLRRMAAETYQRAAWAAYYAGHAELGHRQLRMALRLGQDVQDHALAADVLASLTHHTLLYGEPRCAIPLAEATVRSAERAGLAQLSVDALAMSALGLALGGANGDSRAVLHRAAKMAAEIEATPDSSYLLCAVAQSFRALGYSGEAEWFARRAVEPDRGQSLGTLFWNAVLASVLLDLGRVEEAGAAAIMATRADRTVFPAAAAACLARLARELAPNREQPAVRDFYGNLAVMGIPVPPV